MPTFALQMVQILDMSPTRNAWSIYKYISASQICPVQESLQVMSLEHSLTDTHTHTQVVAVFFFGPPPNSRIRSRTQCSETRIRSFVWRITAWGISVRAFGPSARHTVISPTRQAFPDSWQGFGASIWALRLPHGYITY